MQIVIFDDTTDKSFYPLAQTRAVGDLRCGILKLRQRLQFAFEAEDNCILINPALEELYRLRHPDWNLNQPPHGDKLYLNSRIKIDDNICKQIRSLKQDEALVCPAGIIAIRSSDQLCYGFEQLPHLQRIQTEQGLYSQVADLVHDNARLIAWDFENVFYEEENFFETETGVSLLNPYKIWIAEDVHLAPNVVLDATKGPVVIDEGATVMANSVIMGPAYIGKHSLIKVAAKIYGGTSIGPVCKVGGEIEGSIIQAYSNKQHDGFLGHAFIGEWVNIGADTNNSDLKNTYKNVKSYNYLHRDMQDSGSQFMGCVVGDHVKIGINCSLNTGLVIGTGSNIFGGMLFSGYIPDFSWGEADNLTKYRFPAFCDTAAIVKRRRELSLTDLEIELLKQIFGA